VAIFHYLLERDVVNTYLDFYQYQKQPTGLVLGGYLGNQFRFTSTQAAGTSTLTVPASAITVPLNYYDDLYIFDGPSSEVVRVASETAITSTSIPLVSATQYQHQPGVPVCSDGPQGSLGAQIFMAAKWLEDIIYQPLWSTSYTGEMLTLPTMRAALDNKHNLHFRPRHFPITAFSSISIQLDQTQVVHLDPTQAIIDSDQITVDIPNINLLQSGGLPPPQGYPFVWQPFNRASNAWITLAYTAGFVVGQLPWAVSRACILLTNDLFGLLENPMGADAIQQNKRKVEFVVRGDTSGESVLVKQAKMLLDPYTVQSF
jgi:hypothetical protein